MSMVMMGDGGWFLLARQQGLPGPRTYVRMAPVAGRLRAVELYVDGDGQPLAQSKIGEVALSRVEAEAGDLVRQHGVVPMGTAPEMSVLASHLGATWAPPRAGDPPQHWVAEAYLARNGAAGVARPKRKPLGRLFELEQDILDGPPVDGLTDGFLGRVASSYATAVRQGLPPAPTLAGQAHVSPRTVHRWVRLARERGIMAQGRQGVVG